MDGRQSYEVIHKGGLMESETETENYKNTSMPPSARLEENKKKEPFSSAAAGSLSVVITGTSSPESAILAGPQPSVSQAGLNTHRQERAGAARRQEGQPPHRGSPLGAQALGLFWGMAPRTARVALSSETHGRLPAGPRAALPLSHVTPFSLQTSPLPHCHPGPAFFPRHDLKGTEGQP